MRTKWFHLTASTVATIVLLFDPASVTLGQQKPSTQTDSSPALRRQERFENLKEGIRHRLATLPNYSAFDWLQAGVRPEGAVILQGQVMQPLLKHDAEVRIREVAGVTRVINAIEVLPVSSADDGLRASIYGALFRYDSPLFRYGNQVVPPIHVIVKNGDVTLKGVVANQFDSQIATTKARSISGVFSVKNELRVEERAQTKVRS